MAQFDDNENHTIQNNSDSHNPGADKKTAALEDKGVTDDAPDASDLPDEVEEEPATSAEEKPTLSKEDTHSISFDNQSAPKAHNLDPARDTAILSRNNPMLRRAIQQAQHSDDEISQTMELSDTREVILLIRGMIERVVMSEKIVYKLGRFEIGSSNRDEIDLTPYGAIDRGVSRIHAQIHLENNMIYITDLGSTNGTYVRGNRITAFEPTALHKGDELLLGRLNIQVLFR